MEAEITSEVWEVLHHDWTIKGGVYSSEGAAGLTQNAVSLLPIEVEDGMMIEVQCGDLGGGNWENFGVIYAYVEENLAWAAGAGVGNDQWRIFQYQYFAFLVRS